MPDPQPDFAAQRCTCEDWTRRRARFMVDDPRRCCTHLVQGYLEDATRLPPGLARHAQRLAWFAGEAEGFPVTRQILALALPGGQPCEAYVPWDEADPWIAVLADGARCAFHRTQRYWREGQAPPEALRPEVEAALARALALHKELPRERGKAKEATGTPEDTALPSLPLMDMEASLQTSPQSSLQTSPALVHPESPAAPAAPAAPDASGASPAVSRELSQGESLTLPRFQMGARMEGPTSHDGPRESVGGGVQGVSPLKVAAGVLVLVAAFGVAYLLISRGAPLDLAVPPMQAPEQAPEQAPVPAPGVVHAPLPVPGPGAGTPAAPPMAPPAALPGAAGQPGEFSATATRAIAAVQTRHLPDTVLTDDQQQAQAMRAFMQELPGAQLYVLSWERGNGRMELVVNLARHVLVRARMGVDGTTVAEVYEGFVLERLALAELGKTLKSTSEGEHPPRLEQFFTQ
ncbi:MAG: hypothetical protein LDL30_11435 [Desulfovibrio sp.]|nr:hypothetical protein [Desulfovibrio sp.]MCA1985819.1 hypothetical protein [Desulfovibrio sp.]